MARKHPESGERTTDRGDRRERDPDVREREAELGADRSGDRRVCPECEGRLVSEVEAAETVCADCGLVVSETDIDTGREWHTPGGRTEDEPSRVGPPSTHLLHDKGLSTTIGWQDQDGSGNALSAQKRRELGRLREWNERFRATSSADRNLRHALGEIDRMSSALGIHESTRETASVIYRRALDEGLLPGRSVEGVATAAVYAAARLDGVARSLNEVAVVSRVERLRIERAYRQLARELDLKIPPTDPREYLARFASELGCRDETERRARQLVDSATDEGVHSGKHPVGIAAGALYAAGRLCGEELRQADVAAVADVSEVTIRNRYPEVLDAADEYE